MGYTKEMIQNIKETIQSTYERLENALSFYRELSDVLNAYPERIWGCERIGKNGLVIIGGDLTEQEREEISKSLPYFQLIIFLKGLNRDTHQEDPNLVQRVMMYGGSLQDWKWALNKGEWKKSYQECVKN